MSPPSERFDDRAWRWVIAITLVLFAGAAFYGRQRGLHWGGDDADYALLARGLRSLRYHDSFLVGAPPHTTYPPVYPLFLAPWGAVFGEGVGTLTALNVLFMVAAIGLTAHLVKVHTSSVRVAALVVLVIAVNPRILDHAGRLLSEAPMMFLGAGAIWLADRRSDRPGGVALAIVCAVLCALTRTAGVAVIAGIGAHWLLKRRFRPALALAVVSAVFLGAWWLWTVQEGADSNTAYASRFVSYQREGLSLFGSILSALANKTVNMLGTQISEVLALPLTDATRLDNLAWAPLSLGAVGVGLWSIARSVPAVGFTVLAYAAVLAAWPFGGTRLLVPIIPILSLAAVVGASKLGGRIGPSAARALAVAVASILVVSGAWRSIQSLPCEGSVYSDTPQCVRESEIGLGRAITHLREHAPEDAVVMVRRGEVTYFYTGLLTVPWPRPREARGASADAILARNGVDYILASHAYSARLSGVSILLANACERLAVEFSMPPHTLLLTVRPPDTKSEGNACDIIRRDFPTPEAE